MDEHLNTKLERLKATDTTPEQSRSGSTETTTVPEAAANVPTVSESSAAVTVEREDQAEFNPYVELETKLV